MQKKVLVIGGTQFIGRHTVECLLAAGNTVTILSRGRTKSPFAHDARVAHIRCNRTKPEFNEYLTQCEPCHAIVDFCAFKPEDVRPVYHVLGSRFSFHYIFVSTDSVYMACDPGHFCRPAGRLTEASAVRPADTMLREARHRADEYGSAKLAIEEELVRAAEETSGSFRFTSLRLPDVFGPWENTGRQASLLRKLRDGRRVGLKILDLKGAGANARISLLYAPDAAAAVVATLSAGAGAHGACINVAAREAPTWLEFVQLLANEQARAAASHAGDEHGARDMPLALDASRDTGFLSVDIGPLDISLARRLLPVWTPTCLHAAVRQTAEWAARGKPENASAPTMKKRRTMAPST